MSRRRRSREREEADEAFELSIEGATFRPPFISPWDTGRWAIGLLLITIALAWISVGIDLSNLSQTFQATRGERVPPDLRMAPMDSEEVTKVLDIDAISGGRVVRATLGRWPDSRGIF